MDGTVSCTAAGEELPLKAVGDLGHLDVFTKLESGGTKRKFEGDEEEQEAPLLDLKDEKEQEAPLVDLKDEEEQEAPLVDLEEEKQVSGWNAESGTSLREEQKASQAKKAETAAAKKGLGFFCYGSHGAYRPPL